MAVQVETTVEHFDFDDINQSETFMLSDGTRITLTEATEKQLRAASSQVRSRLRDYYDAWNCDCIDDVACDVHVCWKQTYAPLFDSIEKSPLMAALFERKMNHPAKLRRDRRRERSLLMLRELEQTEVWTDRHGRTHRLDDMGLRYLTNTRDWLVRHGKQLRLAYEFQFVGAPDDVFPPVHMIGMTEEDWIGAQPLVAEMTRRIEAAGPVSKVKAAIEQRGREAYHARTGRWPNEPVPAGSDS